MSDAFHHRLIFYKTFVFLVAYLAGMGWALSCIQSLRWLGIASLGGVILSVWLARRELKSAPGFWRSLGEPLAGWPFLLVAGLALLGQLLYPPTMLDSLTYRLPRIFVWLQNNCLQHIESADERFNYMPHTWELATLPLVQLAGDRLVWGWSFGCWLVLYLVAFDWALELNGEVKKSRFMAFLASTSTFAVLQGASSASDLFATTLGLLALRFIMVYEQTRDWRAIHWAVLSFCAATGAKPHFAVLGLPLAIWFFASPARPWRAFRWVWLPLLLVGWLLSSAAPSFVLNVQTYGSWGGPGQGDSMRGKSPVWNVLLGSTMIVWQNLQPPINPLALVLDKRLDQAVENSGLKKIVHRFNLHIPPVSMVDSSAMGLVTSVLFLAGVGLALKRNPKMWQSWRMLAMVAGWLCILIALSRFVSSSSGRAFCGFLYLALPLALVGWNSMRSSTLKWAVSLSLISSLVAVILYPSHPLWPARWVQQELASQPRFQRVAALMTPYLQYSERANTGEQLMQAIPANETKVLALVGEDRPLLPLFRPYFQGRQVLFLAPHATPTELEKLGVQHVIVGGGAEEYYPELCAYLEQTNTCKLVLKSDYTSKLVRGPEPWRLYQTGHPTKLPPAPPR